MADIRKQGQRKLRSHLENPRVRTELMIQDFERWLSDRSYRWRNSKWAANNG